MKKSKAKKPAKPKKVAKAKRASAKSKSSPFYVQSKRLGFRLLNESDESLYCDLFTDPKAMESLMTPWTRERAAQSFKKALEVTRQQPFKQHISAIVDLKTKKTIGITSLKLVDADKRRAEGGILLKPAAQAKRFAAEAMEATSKEAFKWHAIEELCAQIPVGHKAGERLVVGAGFTSNGSLAPVGDRPGMTCWVLTRRSWASCSK